MNDFIVQTYNQLAPLNATIEQERGHREPFQQPFNTAYIPAQRFTSDSIDAWYQSSLEGFDWIYNQIPYFRLGINPKDLKQFIEHKWATRTAILDVRIDLEDGYGYVSDPDEDTMVQMVTQIIKGAKPLAPRVGFRVKPLSQKGSLRCLKTTHLLLEAMASHWTSHPFILTLPKAEHQSTLTIYEAFLNKLEASFSYERPIPLEIMVENPRPLMAPDTILALKRACPRIQSVHMGVYDMSLAMGIPRFNQGATHESIDFVRKYLFMHMRGLGLWFSDGSLPVLPLKIEYLEDFYQHMQHIMRLAAMGMTQGWDMHPNHTLVRWIALYAFYMRQKPLLTQSLSRFIRLYRQDPVAAYAQDEPAVAMGLLELFKRGYEACVYQDADIDEVGLLPSEVKTWQFP